MFIELRSGEPVEAPRLQIIGALARVQGLQQVAWAEVLNDDDAIGGALIDLAESGGWWVLLLDDLHHVPASAADRLLALLARYARRSRWIVTSRTAPQSAELRPQVLHLGGLEEQALRERRGVVPASCLKRGTGGARAGSPWGLADDGHQVWLPDGSSRSLSDRLQLWHILVCLYEHGGEASKEALVCAVWELSDHHPLRHDNRLQVAIRKVRKLVEVDASKPELLVTTADGYALVGTVRRARLG